MRILVVDDNQDALATLGASLTLEGYAVDLASTVRLALRTAKESPPGVVVLEVAMPFIDGFELVRLLRRLIVPAPLLIAITGRPSPETAYKVIAAGIDHLFHKPVKVDDLLGVISARLPR
jgi:DNA-binding response OmpR family regulator